jgi:hypothetical protein
VVGAGSLVVEIASEYLKERWAWSNKDPIGVKAMGGSTKSGKVQSMFLGSSDEGTICSKNPDLRERDGR